MGWIIVVGGGLRTVAISVGHGARVAARVLLFVESEGVYVDAVAGVWLGSIVEDPEDLSIVRHVKVVVIENTHANHGEQNETSCRSLFGTAVGVNQRVDCRCGEDEACGEEADNLWMR